LRIVGEVAERVSSRRLVDFLPNADGVDLVSSVSFGLFDGDGPGARSAGSAAAAAADPYVMGDDGSMATDMVGGRDVGV
jgi:hypothetical protein